MSQHKYNKAAAARGRRVTAKRSVPAVWAVAGILLLAAVGWAALSAWRNASSPAVPAEVSGAPALRVDRERVDLGDVPLGQTVDVVFTVRNAGDKLLRFEQAPYIEVVEGC